MKATKAIAIGMWVTFVGCGSPDQGATTSSNVRVDPSSSPTSKESTRATSGAPTSGDVTDDPATWRPVKGAAYEGVIAQAQFLPYGIDEAHGAKLDGRWTPSDEDIALAESKLGEAVAKEPRAKGIAPKLASYKRQYVGARAGTRRFIIVNAFCANRQDLSKRLVMVKDGGDCYFHTTFDLDAKTYDLVAVNGEA